MTTYSDYNPAGTTNTTFRAIRRHIPLLPDYFNHQWFEDYMTDFLQKNFAENNGIISGCVISAGAADEINTSGGEAYINGARITVAAPGTYTAVDGDGWYTVYVTSAGAVIFGHLENSTVQGASTPNDVVLIGFAVRGNGNFFIYSFFNNVSEFVTVKKDATGFDQVINTSAQVTAGNGTVYYDSVATSFKDRDGNVVVFNNGDRIQWKGLDTLTAGIDINTIDYLDWAIDPGATIALDSYDLDLGENQRGELDLSGTGTLTILSSDGLRIKNSGLIVDNQAGDIVINNLTNEKSANIEFKNLIAKYISATTLDVDIDSLKLLDANNNSLIVNDIDETLDITSDIHAGSEKASTWYQIWISSKQDGTVAGKLVPDITSITDGTTASKLEDSTADFVTDAVKIGDIVYNTTDDTKTKVSAIDDLNTLSLEDDIFVSGENYTIHILSPTLDAGHDYKANIGAVYNDSGSNFDWFYKLNEYVRIEDISVLSAGNQTSWTPIPLASAIPITAIDVNGEFRTGCTAAEQYSNAHIASDSTGKDDIIIGRGLFPVSSRTTFNQFNQLIINIQTTYYKTDTANRNLTMVIGGYNT